MSAKTNMGDRNSRLRLVNVILFDLHETITQTNEHIKSLTRRVSKLAGYDLSGFNDDELDLALEKVLEFINPYQIENDVDIHFGSEIEDWTEANRVMYDALGFKNLSDDEMHKIEETWKEYLNTWESLRPDAKSTLFELQRRGYQLGICTRRPDDPSDLLKKWGIFDIMSTVQWTSVPGYSKPSPYTLIMAADELGVNPIRCAFVGNSAEADIGAAQRAGMVPVLTIWADSEEADKAPADTWIATEVSDLLELFEGPS
jgi:HAD superfamily hydrolase (TIGR01549 family)